MPAENHRPDLFEYLDFRKYLNDFHSTLKGAEKKHFTHRALGERGGFASDLVSRVLQGQRDISPRMAERFAVAYQLPTEEQLYFLDLVRFTQAADHSSKRLWLEKLSPSTKGLGRQVLDGQYEYFGKWYYSAIRELLNFYEFHGNYSELGRMLSPPISAKQARSAVKLLEKLGLIEKQQDGAYVLTQQHVTSGFDSGATAVNNFVREGIGLAEKSLDIHDRSERNLSSLTFSMDPEDYGMIVEKVREFRRQIIKMVDESEKPGRVFSLNLQFFPLSRGKPIVNRNRKKKSNET